jgi:hypothetical protein
VNLAGIASAGNKAKGEGSMKRTGYILGALVGLTMVASASWLEYWDMSDPAGTDLNGLANSGSLASQWNGGGSGATDGNGVFVISGDSGTISRKLPKAGTANADTSKDIYAAPWDTSQTYSLELNLASWDVDSASDGDIFLIKLNSGGNMLATLNWEVDVAGGGVKLKFGSAGTNYRKAYKDLSVTTGTTMRVEFNIDAQLADYYLDGAKVASITNAAFAGAVDQMVFSRSGSWATAATTLNIDSMGVAAVPEPGTLGLLSLSGIGLYLARRRRRPRN